MIGYFPEPYPDEDLRSILARLAKIMRYPSERIFLQDACCVDSKVHLNDLANVLPAGHSCTKERLLMEHSMYPYFARVASISSDDYYLPMFGRYKFCRICVTRDRATFGEAYWHRLHQCSGVLVCYDHGVPLSQARATHYHLLTAEEVLSRYDYKDYDMPSQWYDMAKSLAADCVWMFTPNVQLAPRAYIPPLYRKLVFELGVMDLNRHIELSVLEELFYECWPSDFIELVRTSMREYNLIARVISTIYGKEPQEPMIHFLLCRWLGYSPEALFMTASKYQPFGCGPWPCLNPFCRNFLKPVIEDVEVLYQDWIDKRFFGQFRCQCGFTYQRQGPDLQSTDAFRIDICREQGSAWDRGYRRWRRDGKGVYFNSKYTDAVDVAVVKIVSGAQLNLLWPDASIDWNWHYGS